MSKFTPQQSAAIHASGNVLLVAGAGTGKTHTLIARCLRLIVAERVSVDSILMVTFTEAAAAEMRGRLRAGLLAAQAAAPGDEWLAQQLALLDAAPIGTLHSFCFQLAREHFHELSFDPQFTILDESKTRPMQRAALDAVLDRHYAGATATSAAVRELIRTVGRGADDAIRNLVVRVHAFAQSLPAPAAWLTAQTHRWQVTEPLEWREYLAQLVQALCANWLPELAGAAGAAAALRKAHETLAELGPATPFDRIVTALGAIEAADAARENWPNKSKTKLRQPFASFYKEVTALRDLVTAPDGDPIAEDWRWARPAMLALLELVREFGGEFMARKQELGGVDFADLEQAALRVLRIESVANAWRARLQHIFVDEYQDINAAQDAILSALSRSTPRGNRFLVGDVKQSIYRFRLANPQIFQAYQNEWRGSETGQVLALTENFRSRQAILDFVNPLFSALLRPEAGGVKYEPLEFGAAEQRPELAHDGPRVDLVVVCKAEAGEADAEDEAAEGEGAGGPPAPDLDAVEREAWVVAQTFLQWQRDQLPVWDKEGGGFRPVRWSDMAVLLRAPAGRAESFAKVFARCGIPLQVGRDGFFASLEVSDLLNLLRLLDNPLQDLPLAAVLRSPLVGLSYDELAQVRLTDRKAQLWRALERLPGRGLKVSAELLAKVTTFLTQFQRWRELVRQTSLSQTLETALLETHYEALLRAGPRGLERAANVRRLLDLAREFDPLQRQGLYRFLRFVQSQEAEALDLEPAAPTSAAAVRLLSVHRSKGLEFPIVAVAGLGNGFNLGDQRGTVLWDEDLGLCPKVTPPGGDENYPSVAHRLAAAKARRELCGEELRLLYVAMTRARDQLLLVGTSGLALEKLRWGTDEPVGEINPAEILTGKNYLAWLRQWLLRATRAPDWVADDAGANRLLRWRILPANAAEFQAAPSLHPPPLLAEAGTAELNSETWHEWQKQFDWHYPHAAASHEAAKTSVTQLRRRVTEDTDDEAKPVFRLPTNFLTDNSAAASGRKLNAAEVGIAHHTFLQYAELTRVATELDLRNQAQALVTAGLLTPEQHEVLHFGDLLAFWESEAGRALQQVPGTGLNREMEFTARLTAAELARLPGLKLSGALAADDFVVVQGQVDLAVLRPDEIWLLDFKTDAVDVAGLPEKVQQYAPQLTAYACALEKIYRRPVTRCWLHFLRARQTVEL